MTVMIFLIAGLGLFGCALLGDSLSELSLPRAADAGGEVEDLSTDPTSQVLALNSEGAFDPCDLPGAPEIQVPRAAASIGHAVEQLGDSGRVMVAPGDYEENIEIAPGAHIVIQSTAPQETSLFPAEAHIPIVRVGSQASLCLQGFSLHGGRAGLVLGSAEGEQAAKAVSLMDVRVSEAQYGIYGLADQFILQSSTVENNVYGVTVAGSSTLLDSTIMGNAHNVLLMGNRTLLCRAATFADSIHTVLVQNTTIMYGQHGGLAICNAKSATVKNAYILQNDLIGVQIHYTASFTFTGSVVRETHQVNHDWGDGLEVVFSFGDVTKSQFSANERANLIYYGESGGTISDNTIIYGQNSICLASMDDKYPNPSIMKNAIFGNFTNSVCFVEDPHAKIKVVPRPAAPDL